MTWKEKKEKQKNEKEMERARNFLQRFGQQP